MNKLRLNTLRNFTVWITVLFGVLTLPAHGQQTAGLAGFSPSPFFDEQVVTFRLSEDMTIHIDAASVAALVPDRPVGLALYALPNGNTIEQTVGKVLQTGDDWHYDIQHIGAQTRFLRERLPDYNLVTVYLEATQLSWPTWKTQFPNYDDITRNTVEYLLACFEDYDPFIILTGHSGGGRFVFDYLDGVAEIPDYVKRICFLDSNYGYDNSYGAQFITWLDGAPDRCLSVIAYNDSIALYNGEPIVSPTGGTWYRSRLMQRFLADHYEFTTVEDDAFIHHSALSGRIEIMLKKNPDQVILHTVQVERNGFIHTMLTGTSLVNTGYTYYGERAYTDLIQTGILPRPLQQIPLRRGDAPNGSAFMNTLMDMSFGDRETAILNQLLTGNMPYFMRDLVSIDGSFQDASGVSHAVTLRTMPDYLSIGADSNYCRVPMGPITAQRLANFYGMVLPTRKLVDHIYANAEVHLAPVTYAPVGNQNEGVPKFIEHNTAITGQLVTAGAQPGQLIGGTKKDVVLSNLIIDPARPGHVTIYGWHQLNGVPIQPLTNIHSNAYVDYSHGIRLLDARVTLDGTPTTVTSILQSASLYTLLSDESGPMIQPTYIPDGSLPARPTSFGAVSETPGQARLLIHPDANILQYQLFTSSDGLTFGNAQIVTTNDHLLEDLPPDAILYFKLVAENLSGVSSESEVLAVLPSGSDVNKALIVNGFDRSSTGNTYDFIRQHGAAMVENGGTFDACTNDAVVQGLLDLTDYLLVDFILGEESTADETFSTLEQSLVSTFLKQGGRLFVSGAEIAWDLDYRGSTTDKSFIHNYLKATYSADAPGGVSGMYYTVEGIPGSMLEDVTSIQYDNGTHGTFNVVYPDALIATNGSTNIARYLNVSTHNIAGVGFEGTFPGGTAPGKLVYLGFPFETIYPATTRNAVMAEILDYLTLDPSAVSKSGDLLPNSLVLLQNYPNPFNPSTTLRFGLPEQARVTMDIYDLSGKTVRTLVAGELAAGWHELEWRGQDDEGRPLATGMYLAQLAGKNQLQTIKMLLIK